FNTLNAISSLVLTKRYERANNMLEKLSGFLRYSLVNQPTQKTTFEHELHALKLYLDIEKVRFHKRLKIKFKISPEAKMALMPSLLLQPLVENAVKYAIAPSETGGEIIVSGACEGDDLVLKVRDNGPGIGKEKKTTSNLSSGVGIANIEARLLQLYGTRQSFTLKNVKPRGLEAKIIIPCEYKDKGIGK
ncbi:MAG: histidine kinase, partial [Sphingomonadales bacterium]